MLIKIKVLVLTYSMLTPLDVDRQRGIYCESSVHSNRGRWSWTLNRLTRYPFSLPLRITSLTNPQVSRIKERIEEKEGIPPVQQRIIFGGKQMYPIQSPLMIYANLSARVDDKSACTYLVDCEWLTW